MKTERKRVKEVVEMSTEGRVGARMSASERRCLLGTAAGPLVAATIPAVSMPMKAEPGSGDAAPRASNIDEEVNPMHEAAFGHRNSLWTNLE